MLEAVVPKTEVDLVWKSCSTVETWVLKAFKEDRVVTILEQFLLLFSQVELKWNDVHYFGKIRSNLVLLPEIDFDWMVNASLLVLFF